MDLAGLLELIGEREENILNDVENCDMYYKGFLKKYGGKMMENGMKRLRDMLMRMVEEWENLMMDRDNYAIMITERKFNNEKQRIMASFIEMLTKETQMINKCISEGYKNMTIGSSKLIVEIMIDKLTNEIDMNVQRTLNYLKEVKMIKRQECMSKVRRLCDKSLEYEEKKVLAIFMKVDSCLFDRNESPLIHNYDQEENIIKRKAKLERLNIDLKKLDDSDLIEIRKKLIHN